MSEITREELAAADGRNGKPAYVAYKGTVYDVSDSDMWDDGDHMGSHDAGADLTEEQEDAPHDEAILDLPVVGALKD